MELNKDLPKLLSFAKECQEYQAICIKMQTSDYAFNKMLPRLFVSCAYKQNLIQKYNHLLGEILLYHYSDVPEQNLKKKTLLSVFCCGVTGIQ